jgi:hypothetical protein
MGVKGPITEGHVHCSQFSSTSCSIQGRYETVRINVNAWVRKTREEKGPGKAKGQQCSAGGGLAMLTLSRARRGRSDSIRVTDRFVGERRGQKRREV